VVKGEWMVGNGNRQLTSHDERGACMMVWQKRVDSCLELAGDHGLGDHLESLRI